MSDREPRDEDWSEAVSLASAHVQERDEAIEAAEGRQRPKPRGPLLAALAVCLVIVLAWDVYLFTRAPEVPPRDQEVTDMRWFVADVVDVVEDFRAENGRLPARGELADLVDPEVRYEVVGDDTYLVGLESEAASVEYRSTTPLDEWVSSGVAR